MIRALYGSLYIADRADERKLIDAGTISPEGNGAGSVATGFFELPDSQHVSAVFFSNGGTWAKFSRMGVQTGRYEGKISQIRLRSS